MIHFTNAQRQFAETGIHGNRFASIWGENGNGSDFIEFRGRRSLPASRP
jgi:hypothetical protein